MTRFGDAFIFARRQDHHVLTARAADEDRLPILHRSAAKVREMLFSFLERCDSPVELLPGVRTV